MVEHGVPTPVGIVRVPFFQIPAMRRLANAKHQTLAGMNDWAKPTMNLCSTNIWERPGGCMMLPVLN